MIGALCFVFLVGLVVWLLLVVGLCWSSSDMLVFSSPLLSSLRLLLGLDRAAYSPQKPASVINAAYNDAAGITSAFILNALSVVNTVVGHGMNLNVDDWIMRAVYSEEREAMEIFTGAFFCFFVFLFFCFFVFLFY